MDAIISKDSLRDTAYRHIQNKLLAGTLSAGSRIAEQSMAEELGVSRTPVREAIKQLEQEGFLTSIPRYGTTVRMPRTEEIVELYELRLALETYCAAKAARTATPVVLDQLSMLVANIKKVGEELNEKDLKVCTKDMYEKYLALDMAFHLVIVSNAKNTKIDNIMQDFRVFTGIFCSRRNDECGVESIEVAYKAHDRILNAIQQQDSNAAREATAEHIELSRDRTQMYYREKQGSADHPFQALAIPDDLLKYLEGLV